MDNFTSPAIPNALLSSLISSFTSGNAVAVSMGPAPTWEVAYPQSAANLNNPSWVAANPEVALKYQALRNQYIQDYNSSRLTAIPPPAIPPAPTAITPITTAQTGGTVYAGGSSTFDETTGQHKVPTLADAIGNLKAGNTFDATNQLRTIVGLPASIAPPPVPVTPPATPPVSIPAPAPAPLTSVNPISQLSSAPVAVKPSPVSDEDYWSNYRFSGGAP